MVIVDLESYALFSIVNLKNIFLSFSFYGKLITAKGTKTSKGELMHFGTFLDVEGEVFDTVHFPKVAKRYSLAGIGVYFIRARVMDDLGCLSIIADFVERQAIVSDPRHNEKSHKEV